MRILVAAALLLGAASAQAMLLAEMYKLSPEQRAWYLGGVYDRAAIDPVTAKCVDKITFLQFVEEVQRFVSNLPADPSTADRRAMDNMPAALVSELVLDKACAR